MARTLYIERSVSNGRNGGWVEELDLTDVGRIVVGTGPGSFAGIRAALAFAQGYALGRTCEVLGLPSPCAIAAQVVAEGGFEGPLAVVGDARRGRIWIALFEGLELVREVFQVEESGLNAALPSAAVVVSPDHARIGEKLTAVFGARYRGERLPTDAGLAAFAAANPSALQREPLPIYLNPAVRD